jgi:hypothetical protein
MRNKILLIIILSGLNLLLNSQDCKIDLSKYPKLASDNSFSPLNRIFEQSQKCKIVFSDGLDTIKYKKITNRISRWFLNDKTKIEYLFSSASTKINTKENYVLLGIFKDFANLRDYRLPLSFKDNIWSLGKIKLDERSNAIVIINKSANCLAILGNSYEAIDNLHSRWLGYYDYYILQDNIISYFGNLIDGKFDPDSLVDIELIRKENYSRIIENDFVKAHFSCRFDDPNKYKTKLDSLNDIFKEFCKVFKINMPTQKLDYFIHSDFTEINIVSGSPKPGKMSGFVVDGLIHTVGLDLGLLMHEGVHFIFLNSIKYRDQFFNEGIPGFFGLYLHPDQINTDKKLLLDYLDYDFKSLITGKTDFFRGPYKDGQLLSYQISGLFVKFLVDTYGIDKTIEFYKYPDLTKAFETVFEKKIETIISDWIKWILSRTKK